MRAARRTSSRTEKSSTPFGTRSSSSRRPRSGPPSTRWGRTSTSRRASAANPTRARRSMQASAGPRSDSGTCTSGDSMEDVSSRIVEKAIGLGCQDAIADVITNRSYQIRFAQNEAVISNRWRESTASVFFVYDKRVLASDIKDLTQLDAAVERLVKIAKSSQKNPDYAGIAKGPFRYARVRPDPKVLSLDEGGKYVEAAIGGATDQGAKECAGSFWKYEDEHFLATSNGVEAHDHRASLYLSIRALVSLESSGHGIACATKFSQFNPEKAGRKAGRIAALARSPKPGKAGRYTAVFYPLTYGSLMDQTGGRLGAWTVVAGLSPFGKLTGEEGASPRCPLADYGFPGQTTPQAVDAAGVPTRRNVLVNKGVLKTYLHNTSTAKKFRTKTTGNAGLVSPDPHAIFVKPGDRSRDEIFSEVKDGLWLTNTWYTRYQSYVTGDLSTIPRDGIFHIQKGEVVEAWKDIRLTDNLLHLLKNIVALGDEPEQMMWWGEVSIPNFVPYAVIKDVGITRSAE